MEESFLPSRLSLDPSHLDGSGSYEHEPGSPAPDEEASLGIQRVGHWPVGLGGHSDVWKAKMTRAGSTLTVALKVLRMAVSVPRLRKREGRERIWMTLKHENIAVLYAVYHQSNGSPVFVSQWYENGTADKYLQDHPSVEPMKIILEIASGLDYLHSRGIVHGDLKPANVLIDDDGHARIADFGLSRLADADPGLTTGTSTSLRWCAPELLTASNAHPTTASDVYSFASTALQLLTGDVPYSTLGDRVLPLEILSGVTPRRRLAGGARLPAVYSSAALWDVLERCWAEAARRPGIRDVRRRLLALRLGARSL